MSKEFRLCYEELEQRVLVFDFQTPVHIHNMFVKDSTIHRQGAVTYASWHDTTLKLSLLY